MDSRLVRLPDLWVLARRRQFSIPTSAPVSIIRFLPYPRASASPPHRSVSRVVLGEWHFSRGRDRISKIARAVRLRLSYSSRWHKPCRVGKPEGRDLFDFHYGYTRPTVMPKRRMTMAEKTKHPSHQNHHDAAAHHSAAAHHHHQAAHHHSTGEHDKAKQHATTAHEHSEKAHGHSKTAHEHSHK
jgi:hypothetical protein